MLVGNWGTEKTARNGWELVYCGEDNGAKRAMSGHYRNCISVPGSKSEKDKTWGRMEIHTRDGLL